VVDGKVYVATGDGDVHVLALAREKRSLPEIDMDEATLTSPVFANGTLYVATRSTLYALAGKERPVRGWPALGGGPTRNPVRPWDEGRAGGQVEERDAKGKVVQPPKNIRWSARLGSLTHGDPVVADGLVWVGTNNVRPGTPAFKEDAGVLACF